MKQWLTGKRLFKIFAWAIILFGIVIRLVVYLQNRNLMIDEANLARNIYERSFLGLAAPLDYQQFAPPLFLWIIKSCAILFGYSEYALRLFPILASFGTLLALYLILKEFVTDRSAWYPLLLFATATIFIRFSSEFKQHGGDVLIVLSLLLLALKTDINTTKPARFFLLWAVAGSITIWLSMPGYFALGGVSAYYLCICFQKKDYRKLAVVLAIGIVWLCQALFYYIVFLRPAITSDYANNELHDKFLFLIPKSKADLQHNWHNIITPVHAVIGPRHIITLFNIVLIFIACVWLAKKHLAKGLLLTVPLIAVLLAACLHQYAMEERYLLFFITLVVILTGIGFDRVISTSNPLFIVPSLIVIFIGVSSYNGIGMLYEEPYRYEEIEDGLAFLKEQHITGDQLFVHSCAIGTARYYTEITPNKGKWSQFKGLTEMNWDTRVDDSLANTVKDRAALLFARGDEQDIAREKGSFESRMGFVTSFTGPGWEVVIYDKRIPRVPQLTPESYLLSFQKKVIIP